MGSQIQAVSVRMSRSLERDQGGVGPLMMILFVILVGFVGISYDSGVLFTARRESITIAGAAARAGANELDQSTIYAGDPRLDPAAAVARAQQFAFDEDSDTALANVGPDLRSVTIEVTQSVDLFFLSFFGIGPITVTGNATAELEPGGDSP